MSAPGPLILVVEDDPDVSDGMVSLLEEEGFRAATASDGEEGLKKLRELTDPSLVLLDLTMPRMSAAEFRSQQSKDPRIAGIPVMLMSAGLDVGRQAKALGAIAFIAKPFKPPALIEAIGRALSEKPDAQA